MFYKSHFFSASLVIATLLISACSKTYQPQEYSLRDKLIRDFEVSGDITVTAINMRENPKVIYDQIIQFRSSYQDIAQVMAQQLSREIKQNSTIDGDVNKQLYIQLDHFFIEPGDNAVDFFIDFTVIGERGFEKQFALNSSTEELVKQDIEQAFDNAIAMGVKKILFNADVLQYMARIDLK